MPSHGERESELARAVARFHREAFGRGPVGTRAFLLDGLAVVALRGVLTPPEARLARSADSADVALVHEVRARVTRRCAGELAAAAETALGLPVRGVLGDVDLETDEAVIAFTLAQRGQDAEVEANVRRGGVLGESDEGLEEDG